MRNWIAIDLINVSIEFHGYLRNWPTIYESASLLDVLCKPIIGRFHYNNNILYCIFHSFCCLILQCAYTADKKNILILLT